MASQQQDRLKGRRKLEKQDTEATRRIKRLTLAIADSAKDFAEIRTVLEDQAAARERCRRELAYIEAEPSLLLLHGLAPSYRRGFALEVRGRFGEMVGLGNAKGAGFRGA